MDPLTHFETYGWKQGRDPSPDFDVELYLAHNPDVKASGMNPLDHYLLYGKAEGRATYDAIGNAKLSRVRHGVLSLRTIRTLPRPRSILTSTICSMARNEGRDPNPYFDTDAYLAANPDVAASGMNPLEHYDMYGWKEGRDPSAAFDTNAYLAANPDVAAAHTDPLLHFLKYGIYEGRDPHGDGILS